MTGLLSHTALPDLRRQPGEPVGIGDFGCLVFLNGRADVHSQHEGSVVLGADGGAHQFGHGVTDTTDAGAHGIGLGNDTGK